MIPFDTLHSHGVSLPGVKRLGVKLTPHLLQVSRLKISRPVPLLSLFAFMACKRSTLYLLLCCYDTAVYEIMWKTMVEPDRPQMTITYDASTLHSG
jgi:hypothetical protein